MAGFLDTIALALSRGAEGGFKAWGENSTEKLKQAALDARDANLARMQAEGQKASDDRQNKAAGERQKEGFTFTAGENKLSRESAATLQEDRRLGVAKENRAEREFKARESDKVIAAKGKYASVLKIVGPEGNEMLVGTRLDNGQPEVIKEGGKPGVLAAAEKKAVITAITKAQEMKDAGQTLDDINAYLRSMGIPEWVEIPTGKTKSTGWFSPDKQITTFGPPKSTAGKPQSGASAPGKGTLDHYKAKLAKGKNQPHVVGSTGFLETPKEASGVSSPSLSNQMAGASKPKTVEELTGPDLDVFNFYKNKKLKLSSTDKGIIKSTFSPDVANKILRGEGYKAGNKAINVDFSEIPEIVEKTAAVLGVAEEAAKKILVEEAELEADRLKMEGQSSQEMFNALIKKPWNYIMNILLDLHKGQTAARKGLLQRR